MAFTNQLTTSTADFFSKLDTFLTANGWTVHRDAVAGEFAADKNPTGSVWVTFGAQWDTSNAQYVGIYQWHGQTYDTTGVTGSVPYDQDDDSGNGAASTTNATLGGQRSVNFGATGTGVEEMWVFEDTNYFHCVIRRDTNIYEHFGAGYLSKTNDWTGGEYCYGHRRDVTFSAGRGVEQRTAMILLDAITADDSGASFNNAEEWVATLHIEGMDDQTTEKWGVVMGTTQPSANLGTARNADGRIHVLGGYRGSFLPSALGMYAGSIGRGLVPFVPVLVGHWNRTTNDIRWPLGQMEAVAMCSIRNFTAEQEVVVGGDTWVVFPAYQVGASAAGQSRNLAVAYKQVS